MRAHKKIAGLKPLLSRWTYVAKSPDVAKCLNELVKKLKPVDDRIGNRMELATGNQKLDGAGDEVGNRNRMATELATDDLSDGAGN